MRRQETQRQQQQQQPVVEEGTILHAVHLQASTPVDGTLPGLTLKGASLLAWHPTRQRLLTASTAAVVEYDAVSGARRNLAEVTGTPLSVSYTPSGNMVVLLTKERGIYGWGTNTWKRRVLLAPDPKYAGKKLHAGLMAVSGGQFPTVYWTPLGKNTVRMVQTSPVDVPKGGKVDRELVPGVKLKTENKKPIVGLAVHPTERSTLFVLLADGTLQVCGVSGAAMGTLHSLPIPGISATSERVGLHAWPHPAVPGGALLAVEAAATGVTILDAPPRQEPRMLGTLSFGPGSLICGVGLMSDGLLCAAGRLASGNVQVQAWELLGDGRELQVLPTVASPGMVWDALQSMVGKAALADVSGENAITRLHFHPPTGAIAVSTGLRGRETEAGHHRVPLLYLVDGADVAGAPSRSPLHTGLGFWTAHDSDSVVSKLRFPRYAHVISGGKVCNYDLTHGMLSDCLALPPANASGQQRELTHAVRSAKQAAWLAFTKIVSRKREGAPMSPGQYEFSLVNDSEAALTTRQWMLPGADGTFVGGQDDLVVVLSNSGRSLIVYETGKLSGTAAKPLYSAELKEGLVAAVYPGPPAHIPAPPIPPPEAVAGRELADSDDSDDEDDETAAARREWEAAERRRLEPPRLVLLRTQANQLCLAEVSPSAVTYSNKSRVLPVRATLPLRQGEAVVQVAWQSLMPADASFHTGSEGAGSAAAACAAVLTSQRLLIVNERLGVVCSAGLPSDMGLPVSCLWMGPALLVSTATGQVVQACWDGKLVHLCSLLNSQPPALLGALADRLLIATRATSAGRAEVAGRGISVLQPLLLGWASLAARHLLPGGMPRVRHELRTLVSSYDASQLGVGVLERLAAAGFADVAAAVAARSDSPAITLAHKAVFQAAAGDWQPLLLMVMQEWEGSTYHPGPPPRSSQLYAKMVALARTCQQYGRFQEARQLLEAAGAHAELLALCVFQGDFQGLQEAARQGGRDVERLADQLMAVNENAFSHGSTDGSLYGGRPNTDDWRVTAAAAAEGSAAESPASGSQAGDGMDVDGEEGGEARGEGGQHLDIDVAPAGRLPFQEASLQVLSGADPAPGAGSGDEEGHPIQGLDLGTLEAYVGVTGGSVIKAAVSTPTAAGARAAAAALGSATSAVALDRSITGMSELSNPTDILDLGAGASTREAAEAGYDSGSDVAGGASKDETAAQAAARAAFRRDADDDDDFFSSDEESAPTETDSRSVASASASASGTAVSGATGSQRFKIAIKSAEEASSQGSGSDAGALRAAAQNLRLGSLDGSSFASRTGASAIPASASLSVVRSSSMASSRGGGLTPPGASAASTPVKAPPPAPQEPVVASDDPFADLFGLGTPSSSSQQLTPSSGRPPQPPGAAAVPAPASSGPMRPQPPPQPAQSNLLAGWDDFEALFAAGPKPPAQQSTLGAPAAAAGGSFDPFAFPPPPVPAALKAPAAAPAAAPSSSAAGAAAGGAGLKKSGSVADLAPAAAKQAVSEGLSAFSSSKWDVAATQFGKALDKVGSSGEPAFLQMVLQLFVAARLLAAAKAAAGKKAHATAARLARFAIALPLEEAQRLAAVSFAVDANIAAKNYGFAADQLTWMVVQATAGTSSGLNTMDLQEKLNACDRGGGSNAALPRDEDRESFAAIVGSCSARGEAEELLTNIISG